MAIKRSIYLSPDAFRLPNNDEVKGNETKAPDYKSLYGDSPLFTNYIKEPTNDADKSKEPNENKLAREQFQTQFNNLLDKLENWGKEHKCNFPEFIKEFKKNFFDPYWSGMHDPIWFDKYKKNLETIWFHTQKPNLTEIEKDAINFLLTDAFQVCSPGSSTNVATLVVLLANKVSMPHWLSQICNKAVDGFADKHIRLKDIRVGIRNHVILAFRTFARNDEWPCSYDTAGTRDAFASETKIEPTDLLALASELEKSFTPQSILNRIQENFKLQVQAIFGKKDATAWVVYDLHLVYRIEDVLKKLEFSFDVNSIIDLNGKEFRFNEFKFNQLVLKELRDKKKLFKEGNWIARATQLPNLSCCYFNDGNPQIDLIFVEDAKEGLDIPFSSFLELTKHPSPIDASIKKLVTRCADTEFEKALKDKNYQEMKDILRFGYSLSKVDQNGQTLIRKLANQDAWDEVTQLLNLADEQKSTGDMQLSYVLLQATQKQQWDLAYRLIETYSPMNLHCPDPEDDYCVLHFAIQHNQIDLAELLILKGAGLNYQVPNGKAKMTPLMVAARPEVKIETFNWLLEKHDINLCCQDPTTLTALTMAAWHGQTEKVRKLILKHRKNNSLSMQELNLAFHNAVIAGHIEIAEALIFAGATMDYLQKTTDLDRVVADNKWKMFNFLIRQGYSLTQKNSTQETPILIASVNQQWNSVKLILQEKITDPEEAQLGGALVHACEWAEWELANELLKYKMNLNLWSRQGYYAFHWVILHNQIVDEAKRGPSLAKRLINMGVNVNHMTEKHRFAPLHLAASKPEVKVETLHWLLEQKGIEVNIADPDGNTPLMLAVMSNSPEKVTTLLKYPVKLEAKRKDGKTVYEIAMEMKNHEIIALFTTKQMEAKQKIDRADYQGASAILLEIFANNLVEFFQLLHQFKPDIRGFAKLTESCLDVAAENKNPEALNTFFEEYPSQEVLTTCLAKALKSNNLGKADMLLKHYQPSKSKESWGVETTHPLYIATIPEVSFETFKWLLSHPQLQLELKNHYRLYRTMAYALSLQNDSDKLHYILQLEDAQSTFALDLYDGTYLRTRISYDARDVFTRNYKIKELLTQIHKNKLPKKIDTSVLQDRKVVNAILFKMGMNEHDLKRIGFVLNQFTQDADEEKIDYTIPPNLEWYSQAFMLAHNSTDEKNYKSRQKNIRHYALNHFKLFLATVPKEQRQEWIVKAKPEPIFNQHTRRHFDLFGSPDTLALLDKWVMDDSLLVAGATPGFS